MIQVRRAAESDSFVFEVVVCEGNGETHHHVTRKDVRATDVRLAYPGALSRAGLPVLARPGAKGINPATLRHCGAWPRLPPVDRERTLCSVSFAYAEEYLVDVKFVCDRIGTVLFDHLVGDGQQARWHVEAERLRGLQVDHELEFRLLQDWQVGGLCTFKNPGGSAARVLAGLKYW
jgi:hypothetical protein